MEKNLTVGKSHNKFEVNNKTEHKSFRNMYRNKQQQKNGIWSVRYHFSIYNQLHHQMKYIEKNIGWEKTFFVYMLARDPLLMRWKVSKSLSKLKDFDKILRWPFAFPLGNKKAFFSRTTQLSLISSTPQPQNTDHTVDILNFFLAIWPRMKNWIFIKKWNMIFFSFSSFPFYWEATRGSFSDWKLLLKSIFMVIGCCY